MKQLDGLVRLLEQAPFLEEQRQAAEDLRTRQRGREVIVSVIGQFKRGKSSLLNAMLGEALLPVGIIPLTTVVTEIRFAPAFRACVAFRDGGEREIRREELSSYCSEQKNPKNSKGVETVKLWTPCHPFGEGVVLVDTPGVGSVHQHNTDCSYAYVERSDAVLFLLSVDSPVSETERAFLLQARTYAAKFFFAVNKADTVAEEDLTVFLDFCRGVLSEAMDREVTLQAVSARTGQGIEALLDQLRGELQGTQILEASLEKKQALLEDQARAKLTLAIQAAGLPAEELERKLKRIRGKQRELAGFSEEIQVLSRHRTDRLVAEIQDQLESRSGTLLRDVERRGRELAAALADRPAREFEEDLQSQLDDVLRQKLEELDREGSELLEKGYREIVDTLNCKAAESARFLADLLREEFGLDYPISESSCAVSERSDFFLRIGSCGTLLLNVEALSRLLPRRAAHARYLEKSLRQAEDDIHRNRNNMVANYRYRMQESLRGLCAELSGRVEQMAGELEGLLAHVESHRERADQHRADEVARLTALLCQLERKT